LGMTAIVSGLSELDAGGCCREADSSQPEATRPRDNTTLAKREFVTGPSSS
jgi:hypothetical protein